MQQEPMMKGTTDPRTRDGSDSHIITITISSMLATRLCLKIMSLRQMLQVGIPQI